LAIYPLLAAFNSAESQQCFQKGQGVADFGSSRQANLVAPPPPDPQALPVYLLRMSHELWAEDDAQETIFRCVNILTGDLGGHLKTGHLWSLQNRPLCAAEDVTVLP
jgi:hypothetical protein